MGFPEYLLLGVGLSEPVAAHSNMSLFARVIADTVAVRVNMRSLLFTHAEETPSEAGGTES